MRQRLKKWRLVLMTAAVVCILLAPPAAAEDRYWINYFGGDWVDPLMINWKTSTGVTGLPGPGDRALIVLPYPLVGDQPVYVNAVSPGLPPNSIVVDTVIIESGNTLNQRELPYFPSRFPSGYNMNLMSNIEIVGGSGETFTAPPGYFLGNPNPPAITPKGSHYQSTGTNTVTTELILGGTAGSEGTYTLSGTGSLSVGFMEKVGSAGTGIFTQSGGSHTVGTILLDGTLILGMQTGSSGTYNLSGNSSSLTVLGQEIIGSAGTGTFTQSGGTHTTDLLMLGQQTPGRGTYDLRGGALQVTGINTVGKEGLGEFFQYSGSTHNAQYLTIGSEVGGTGIYSFYGGSLGVSQTLTVGKSGSGEFYHQGLVTKAALNADNLVLAEQTGSVGTYTLNAGPIGPTPDLNVSNMTIGHGGTGTFNHSSGWVSAGNLVLAEQTGSTGTYTLNAGSVGSTPDVNVADDMTIGRVGTGTFNQNNGWVQVGQMLDLGSDEAGKFGTGTYNLGGGRLTIGVSSGFGPRLNVGFGGNGIFNQTSGEVKIEGVDGKLEIGGYPSGSGIYSITGGTLSTAATLSAAYVGVAAVRPGLFIQDGFSAVTISGNLDVMYQPGINGYFLRGYGELSVTGNTLVDGYFYQGGGVFNAATLEVNSSSTGDYRGNYEKIAGFLGVNGSMQIGNLRHGIFNQNSGDPLGNWTDVNTLALGLKSNATGTFNLNYGTLDVRSEAIVGEAGSGVINHTAGTNTVWGDLILGKDKGSDGEYNLEGANSKLEVKGNEIIGSAGTGTFNQKSTFSGEHKVNGNLILGEKDGGSGTYTLDSGKLDVTGNLFLGFEADGSVGKFTLNSGKLTVTGILTVGSYGHGEFTQNGGEVTVGRLRVGDLRDPNPKDEFDQSIYTLSGNSTLEVLGNEELGFNNNARFNQTGGSHIVRGNLILGSTENSGDVNYELSRGVLQIDGDLQIGHDVGIYQGIRGYVVFNQSGGINYSNGNVIMISKSEEDDYYIYHLVHSTHYIQNELRVIGGGAAYQVSEGSELWVDRVLLQDHGAMWNLGIVHANHIDNHGRLHNDGSIVTPGSTLYNYEAVTMGGTAPVITGRIENYGTFHATNTTATYDGIFNNNGAYISTGSSNRFTDLIVGTGGFLVGGAQDRFFISGNFVNHSTQNTLWDTDLASLIFENAMSHNFYLAGLDLGAIANGFLDNFAWGSFSLAAGEELHLFDGNLDTDGAALYLGLITPMNLDFIFSDFNIYYNAMLPGNEWLAGGRYDLKNGSGWLIPFIGGIEPPGPEPVPEPATMLLLGSGLICLVGYGRKKFFKK